MDVDSEAVERAVDDAPATQSPEQILTRATLDADLQAALDALPDAFRQAVWLRDVEELYVRGDGEGARTCRSGR